MAGKRFRLNDFSLNLHFVETDHLWLRMSLQILYISWIYFLLSPFKTQKMTKASKTLAGILMIVLPTVAYGGTALLSMLIGPESGYMDNPLRQNLFRAGHAHAGVLLILSLIILRYVDETSYKEKVKRWVRLGVPITAILLPLAFFFSVLSPDATQPNNIIYLAYLGFLILTITLIITGVGLVKASNNNASR